MNLEVGTADWFVNVQSGTTSRVLLSRIFTRRGGLEKWSSIASYVEGIKRQERGRLNGTERAREDRSLFVLVADRGIPVLMLL